MAESKTPAEMEAIIWQHDSVDGVDHGAVLRGVCQPDPGAGRPGRRPAELGHRRQRPTLGRCTSGPMSASTRIRRRRASPRSSQDAQAHVAGTRWATATSRSPATGWCSMATSRWSRSTPAGCCTRSAATRCRTSRSTPTSTAIRLTPRASSGSLTTASCPPPSPVRSGELRPASDAAPGTGGTREGTTAIPGASRRPASGEPGPAAPALQSRERATGPSQPSQPVGGSVPGVVPAWGKSGGPGGPARRPGRQARHSRPAVWPTGRGGRSGPLPGRYLAGRQVYRLGAGPWPEPR